MQDIIYIWKAWRILCLFLAKIWSEQDWWAYGRNFYHVSRWREGGECFSKKLHGMVSDSDAFSIEPTNESVYYCVHITRAYLSEGDLEVLIKKMERLIRTEHFFIGGNFWIGSKVWPIN